MTMADALDRGRESFKRRAWRAAYSDLSAADHARPLALEDLERLATAAYLIGQTGDTDLLARAHQEALRQGHPARAAYLAFWLGFGLLDRGEFAQASGWLSRASRVLEGLPESVEHGYLLLPAAITSLEGGEVASAYATFERIADVAERFHDPDLGTLGRLGRGQALVRMADIPRGMAFLDDAMVAVTAGEVSPMVVGIVYCSVIDTCQRLFDLRRAQEWTDALNRWVESQPDLVPYRGQCLLYRAELLELHGAWQDATVAARSAHEQLGRPPVDPAVGAAMYREGELYRLRGEFGRANDSYRESSAHGHRPEPGLALMRLAQGKPTAAASAIRRALDEEQDPLTRPRLLDACVEIMLAAGDQATAATAAGELAEIAERFRAPLLGAMAARAAGAIHLASGDARAALTALRTAWRGWQDVDAPYDAARTRVLIGLAYRLLGDHDAVDMEFEAARQAFVRLGAKPDLTRLDHFGDPVKRSTEAGLTARELEVLRLVAAGKTNRAIASALFISDKTVARHLSNIFDKLGLSSRAAATAYAYEHDLIESST